MEVTRMLVDKERIQVNGVEIMRLYFYDVADGIVLMYDAQIFKSKGVPLLTKDIPEVPIQEEEAEPIVDPEFAKIIEDEE